MPLYKKKYAPKSKLVRRKRLARRPRRSPYVRKGGFNIARKTALIQTYGSTSIAGIMTTNDPSGTCLTLGTPTLVTGSLSCYDIPFSMKFRLDQLMNSNDLTNIADQYMIKSVKVSVHANAVSMSFVGNSGAGQPWIEYIQDHDDATVPSIASIREKMAVRTKFFSGARASVTMGVRPRVADAVFGSGVSTAYAVNKKSQWINTAYPNAEHYGIKGVLHNVPLAGTSGVAPLFDWDVTQYVAVADLQ